MQPAASSDEPSLALSAARRVDAACARFEADWKRVGLAADEPAHRPELARYAVAVAEPERSVLVLELVRVEVYYRRRLGETPCPAEYQARFPDLDPARIAAALDVPDGDPTWEDDAAGTLVPPAPPADPNVGRQLGKYLLTARLGQGGMGVVYRAEDTLLKRAVAVKLLAPVLAQDPEAAQRFLREARAAARVNHPHVVTVHEVDQAGDVCYLVMELVEGGSTQDQLSAGGPVPWPDATRLIADACRGLTATHAAGLLHRDIKPANLLRGRDGAGKLTDFGLAKGGDPDSPSLTAPGGVLGTPHYMSPEQCQGKPVDERTDVYSLGATYHALLTGQTPYAGSGSLEVMFGHCSGPVPDPRHVNADVPDACAAVVRTAMAKEPAGRYAGAAAMLAALEGVLALAAGERGGETAPPLARAAPAGLPVAGAAPNTPAGARRRPVFAVAGGLVAALAIGVAFWTRAGDDRHPPASGGPKPNRPTADKPIAIKPIPDGRKTGGGKTGGPGAGRPDGKPITLAAPLREFAAGAPVESVTVSFDSRYLVWGTTAGAALRDLEDGTAFTFPTAGPIRTVLFRKARGSVTLGYQDGRGEWWFPHTRKEEYHRNPEQQRGPLWGLAYAPREQFLVTAATGPASRKSYLVFRDMRGNEARPVFALPRTTEIAGPTWAVAVAADLKIITGGDEGKLTIWDPVTGAQESLQVGVGKVAALACGAGGEMAAAGENGLEVWDLPARKRLLARPAGRGGARCAAFSPDGRLLAWGDGDDVRLWDPHAGKDVAVVTGHTRPVRAVAFAPDGRTLVTGGEDQAVRLWDVRHLPDVPPP